jgi:integrase/recombinase XerD
VVEILCYSVVMTTNTEGDPTPMSTPTNLHLDAFKVYLENRARLAPGSRKKYLGNVEQFLAWTEANGLVLADVKPTDAEEYLDTLTGAPATIHLKVASIRKFFYFLRSRGKVERDPFEFAEKPEREQKENDYLRDDEDARLLRAPMAPTERFLVYFLRFTGMRVSEALHVEVRDVDLEREEIRVRVSKTRRGRRTVEILPELEMELRIWLERLRQRDDYLGESMPLFASERRPQAITPQYADRLVKYAALKAGVRVLDPPPAKHHVSAVSCHTLRRTYGSWLINLGARIETVSRALGHADTRVTEQAYAELRTQTVKAEIRAAAANGRAKT